MITKRQDSRYLLAVTRRLGLLTLVFSLLNVYWFVPLLNVGATPLSQLGIEDMSLFAPRDTTGFGVGFSILSLHGFWRFGYLYTKDILPVWWLVAIFILFLALYGIITMWRNEKQGTYVKSMTFIAVVSTVLAIGVSSTVTRPMFTFLWENFPLFTAFRDPKSLLPC